MANAEGLQGLRALALWRGCPEEAMTVARCFYDVIFEHLQREWNQPMLISTDLSPASAIIIRVSRPPGTCCWGLRG